MNVNVFNTKGSNVVIKVNNYSNGELTKNKIDFTCLFKKVCLRILPIMYQLFEYLTPFTVYSYTMFGVTGPEI